MNEQTKKPEGYVDVKEAAKGFFTIVGCAIAGLVIGAAISKISNKGE